ncbi:MAG: TonB family protein [Pseudomonadota bacterium]
MKNILLVTASLGLCVGTPALAQNDVPPPSGKLELSPPPAAPGQSTNEADQDSKRVEAITELIEELSEPNFANRDGAQMTNWLEAQPQPADYPAASWLAGEEGLVRFQIAVDAQGKPSRCSITESSGYAALDKTTCGLVMERGEFTAAANEAGEAVNGVYEGRHRWRKRDPEVPGSFRFKATFVVDEEGRSSQCVIEALEGSLPSGMEKSIERNPCPFGSRRNRIPYRDENGVPVAKNVVVEFSAKVSDFEANASE